MKKVIGIIAMLMAVLMLFAACGTGGGNKQATTAETTAAASTAAASTAPAEPPTELVMYFLTNGSIPADLQLVEDEVNKVVTPLINAKIKMNYINMGAAAQQFNLMLSSGENFDLFMTPPRQYLNYVSQGKLQEIGPLLDKYGQGVKEALGDYLKGSLVSGKIYGVRPMSDFAGGRCLLIRQDMVDKYKLDLSVVKTIPDAEKIWKAIKDQDPKATPLQTSGNGAVAQIESFISTIDGLGDSLGVLLNSGDNLNVVNYYETEVYKNNVTMLRDWYKKGYIIQDAATTQDAQFQILSSGRAYAYFTGSKPGIAQQDGNTAGLQLAYVPLTKQGSSTSNITLFQWCVPNASKNAEKAVQMLNLMYTNADLENLLCWGIEGKHYVKKADGLIGFPEGVTAQTSGYNVQMAWQFGNEFLTHVWEGNPPDLWKQTQDWNKNAQISKAMGFSYDPNPVKTEVAACTNVVGQYGKPLGCGAVDVDKVLPEFISKLKAAGIDKIVAEKQKQLDAWAAANNVK